MDQVGPGTVDLIRGWIDSHLNRVRIVEATHGDVHVATLLAVDRAPVEPAVDLGTAHAAPDFDTWHYTSKPPLSEAAVRAAIHGLPAYVCRCKGFVHSADRPDERILLQAVGRRVRMEPSGPWPTVDRQTDLVLIGAPGSIDPERLRPVLDECRSGRPRDDSEPAGSG